MSNGMLTLQINNVEGHFQFEEIANTDPQALFFNAGTREITVKKDGDWDLLFIANGFSFNDNPVSWPKGKPENVNLVSHDAQSFTLDNMVTRKQPLIEFLIHSDIQTQKPIDPTIFNNPPPDFARAGERELAAVGAAGAY
jgi:hypothetical protein